jgi:AcrR family transcriptional regulator
MADREKQKQETRRDLIEASIQLSAEKGFAALSLREVTKTAGVTPAAFYRHFHDMDELGLILIDEVGLSLRQLLREARRSYDGEKSMVRSSVEAFILYITENANLFRILQGEKQGSSSQFRKALFTELGRFIEEVAEDLERVAVQLNQPLIDVELAAEAIVSVAFTVGAEVLDLPRHKRNEVAERIIKEIKMILRGALAPTATSPKRAKKNHPSSKQVP